LLLLLLFTGFLIVRTIISVKPSDNDSGIVTNYNIESNETLSKPAVIGKTLFQSNCAACHILFKNSTGPGLVGFEERGPWSDRKKLYDWIHNPPKFMMTDNYTKSLKKTYGVMMTGFPALTEIEIDAIVDYINSSQTGKPIAEK
jgi:mono/diheme cytochrome c family protein